MFKTQFEGIFSYDTIPKHFKNRNFIIVNTDISSGPGKHWFCIVKNNGMIECFDSLGVTTAKQSFLRNHFAIRGITHVTFNVTPVQPLDSTLCGQFVLYFLFERYHNLDMTFDDLLNDIFTLDLERNNTQIIEFMNTLNDN
ncbi:MAG: hypothetical protein FJ333_08300 [Sphingomonadales bacterium]|nr:hypothetical protein [Sphingomonadales bacterium]